jgi:hypothetical protein
MNDLPFEIIDNILYFIVNPITELCQISKYFNINVKKLE